MSNLPQSDSDTTTESRAIRTFSPSAILTALRPSQWTKNTVVLAAFIFAFWDETQPLNIRTGLALLPALVIFCLVSSGIYLFNDIRDMKADRCHPAKRFRPIPSGLVTQAQAWIVSLLLLGVGLAGAHLLSRPFATVVTGYIVLQLLYSTLLKRVALLDVFVIAAGFVLRAIAGAVVVNVRISPWLLLCTFLLALFLALCKRRHEKISTDEDSPAQRAALGSYDERLLDQLIAIVAGATIVSYAIYTLWPETIDKFGTSALGFTIPFVMFGIFRYLDLAYRKSKGDRPDKILLTDTPILVTVLLYGVTVITVFLLHGCNAAS